jgi:hypothetical protein
MKVNFEPGTSEQDVFTLDTSAGRARLFQKRIDEIIAQLKAGGKRATIDDAIYELRQSSDPNDQELLAAMGEKPSAFRTEHLKQEKRSADLHRAAEENAAAQKPSVEVAAAVKAALRANHERGKALNVQMTDLMEKEGSVPDELYEEMSKVRADEMRLLAIGNPIGGPIHTRTLIRNVELNGTRARAISAMKERAIAFNARVTQLMQEGFSFDGAIRQMCANSTDAALIESMQQPMIS